MQSIRSNQHQIRLDWVHLQQAAQYHQRMELTQRSTFVIPCYLLKGDTK